MGMTTTPYRVLGVGSPIVDLLINVDDAFLAGVPGGKGGMVLVSPVELNDILSQAGGKAVQVAGGSAGNTIFGLAKLGVPTSFLGKVGKDPTGEFYTRRLAELGGETRNFRYSDGVYTGRCLCIVTPDSERTMRTDLGAAATITALDVTPDVFQGITHVHIEGYAMFAAEFFEKVLRLAKQAGCVVSLDLASYEVVNAVKNHLLEILPLVDIVFANEDEARAFCGCDEPGEQLKKLLFYSRTAVVKLGSRGCCIMENGHPVIIPTTPVKAVDTTGAGDLWQAGFIYGYLRGLPLSACVRCGAVLGAEVVQVIGAEIPAGRWTDINAKLAGITA